MASASLECQIKGVAKLSYMKTISKRNKLYQKHAKSDMRQHMLVSTWSKEIFWLCVLFPTDITWIFFRVGLHFIIRKPFNQKITINFQRWFYSIRSLQSIIICIIICSEQFSTKKNKSFMKILKSTGPRIEPSNFPFNGKYELYFFHDLK